MRLHLVALPHTQISNDFCGCAYTGKILKFAKMGWPDLHIYAPEGPEIEGATLHPCLTDAQRTTIFGDDDAHRLPDWPTDAQTELFNKRVIEVLKPEPHDLILLSGGWTHLAVANAFPNHLRCEPFIGYGGVILGSVWGAYESYFHMSEVYARKEVNDVRWFDTVIHPFVDVSEFPQSTNGSGKYLLCLSRMIARKGIALCGEIATACDMPLILAGAGAKQVSKTLVVANDGTKIEAPDLTYLGPVGVNERARLMSDAYAVLMPTYYAEPGGNVMFESMVAGTPVLSIDFGIFSEIIKPGLNGYFFRNMKEAVKSVELAGQLPRDVIRSYVVNNYSLGATAIKFRSWFERLLTLFGNGFYEM